MEKEDGKLYNKENKSDQKVHREDYSKKYYYSLGRVDDFLENRIAVFESVIAPILKRIEESNNSIKLLGKEMELLKLFCVLAACRQENISSLIKSDLEFA